jgi:hypothetical protein
MLRGDFNVPRNVGEGLGKRKQRRLIYREVGAGVKEESEQLFS